MIREKIIENVGIIYLDRPEIINSLNMEMLKDIEKILQGKLSWRLSLALEI